MGTFKYDGTTVDFEDRVLAHIEVVAIQKLRKQEAFFMSWLDPETAGSGRTGVWMHPAALLTFHYSTNDNPNVDRAWVEKLAASANSPAGLFVTDVEGKPVQSTQPTNLG
jgi:hypothetical protein